MSRVANSPVSLPSGVEVKLNGQDFSVKGTKGQMAFAIHDSVVLVQEDDELKVRAKGEDKDARAMAGTMRALVQNMVTGVSEGFEKRLELQGVGYRAQSQGKTLTMQLGFSHPVVYELPEGISAETRDLFDYGTTIVVFQLNRNDCLYFFGNRITLDIALAH